MKGERGKGKKVRGRREKKSQETGEGQKDTSAPMRLVRWKRMVLTVR